MTLPEATHHIEGAGQRRDLKRAVGGEELVQHRGVTLRADALDGLFAPCLVRRQLHVEVRAGVFDLRRDHVGERAIEVDAEAHGPSLSAVTRCLGAG